MSHDQVQGCGATLLWAPVAKMRSVQHDLLQCLPGLQITRKLREQAPQPLTASSSNGARLTLANASLTLKLATCWLRGMRYGLASAAADSATGEHQQLLMTLQLGPQR